MTSKDWIALPAEIRRRTWEEWSIEERRAFMIEVLGYPAEGAHIKKFDEYHDKR
jgi:hypothetical protein